MKQEQLKPFIVSVPDFATMRHAEHMAFSQVHLFERKLLFTVILWSPEDEVREIVVKFCVWR